MRVDDGQGLGPDHPVRLVPVHPVRWQGVEHGDRGGRTVSGQHRGGLVEPGRRLTATFDGHWAPDVAALPTFTVTFLLDTDSAPVPGVTLLTCVHEGLPTTPTATNLERGWVAILSGLKTLVETGRPMGPAAA